MSKRALLLVLCIPSVALAGTTPLVTSMLGHLLIGNLIIGLLEGALLITIFKTPARRSLISMVLANYFSMWVGVMAINNLDLGPLDLPMTAAVIPWLIAAFFFITVLLESPFVAVCFDAKGWRRITKGALFTHVVSYAAILGWYTPSHQTSLIDVPYVAPAEVLDDLGADVYLLSAERKQVLKIDARGEPEVVYTFETGEKGRSLYFEGGALWAQLENEDNPREITPVVGWCGPLGAPFERSGWAGSNLRASGGPYTESGFYAGQGLSLFDAPEGAPGRVARAHYAFDTLFARWGIYPRPVTLPSGLILFGARDRILVLDDEGQRLTELERGFSPAACAPMRVGPFRVM